MKIFLDDERTTPIGWVRTYTPDDTIALLKQNGSNVTDLSLDHDLGDDAGIGTGYNVLLWLEQVVFHNPSFHVPNIIIHSANPSGVEKMKKAIDSIKRFKGGK